MFIVSYTIVKSRKHVFFSSITVASVVVTKYPETCIRKKCKTGHKQHVNRLGILNLCYSSYQKHQDCIIFQGTTMKLYVIINETAGNYSFTTEK